MLTLVDNPQIADESQIIIGPQPGPQHQLMESPADIVIYGGGAGGGKSFGLLLDPLRYNSVPGFGAVFFRRTYPQITSIGGLWMTSMSIYPHAGGRPRSGPHEWVFDNDVVYKMSHLQHDADVLDWQGSQIPYIGWDELTHFSEYVFFYMLSRNRSACGVAPCIRATCNPDPDSWVKRLISWWLDPKTGFPIAERSGVLRWFTRVGDDTVWGDSPDELPPMRTPDGVLIPPKSLTFIASKVYDNKILLKRDPGYLGNLMSLARVEREQLLEGNWNARRMQGDYFKKEWFGVPLARETLPPMVKMVRYWDRASTVPSELNRNPDWTVGLLMGRDQIGTFYVIDVERFRGSPGTVSERMRLTAELDGPEVAQIAEQDPGQAGVSEIYHLHKDMPEASLVAVKVSKNKVIRALPASGACEKKLMRIVEAPWNDDFFNEVEAFCDPDDLPEGVTPSKDDQVDGLSGAYNAVARSGRPGVKRL